ncbi:hypothetical protein [Sulfurirhabdus autotrophica]|uniref:Uncharacterized protein n=1 Tax=Sulfurirhabdus autotrophica TaxID=1706046 RepID=A0A4R3Y701_9PROT|nr:hypothetical protein [Sulfurirhabdus autotrophica]TCV86668.1 hypothetical protein EDC63_10629 [Sulfurirhabdus autotrophica]
MARKSITKATQLDFLFPEDNQVIKAAKPTKRTTTKPRPQTGKQNTKKSIGKSSNPKPVKSALSNSKSVAVSKPKTKALKPVLNKPKKRSPGLAPEGFVRLTINIRHDLRTKLKIIAAKQNTTIGKLIEDFTNSHS